MTWNLPGVYERQLIFGGRWEGWVERRGTAAHQQPRYSFLWSCWFLLITQQLPHLSMRQGIRYKYLFLQSRAELARWWIRPLAVTALWTLKTPQLFPKHINCVPGLSNSLLGVLVNIMVWIWNEFSKARMFLVTVVTEQSQVGSVQKKERRMERWKKKDK